MGNIKKWTVLLAASLMLVGCGNRDRGMSDDIGGAVAADAQVYAAENGTSKTQLETAQETKQDSAKETAQETEQKNAQENEQEITQETKRDSAKKTAQKNTQETISPSEIALHTGDVVWRDVSITVKDNPFCSAVLYDDGGQTKEAVALFSFSFAETSELECIGLDGVKYADVCEAKNIEDWSIGQDYMDAVLIGHNESYDDMLDFTLYMVSDGLVGIWGSRGLDYVFVLPIDYSAADDDRIGNMTKATKCFEYVDMRSEAARAANSDRVYIAGNVFYDYRADSCRWMWEKDESGRNVCRLMTPSVTVTWYGCDTAMTIEHGGRIAELEGWAELPSYKVPTIIPYDVTGDGIDDIVCIGGTEYGYSSVYVYDVGRDEDISFMTGEYVYNKKYDSWGVAYSIKEEHREGIEALVAENKDAFCGSDDVDLLSLYDLHKKGKQIYVTLNDDGTISVRYSFQKEVVLDFAYEEGSYVLCRKLHTGGAYAAGDYAGGAVHGDMHSRESLEDRE